jgi:hypothetical protein
MIMQLASLIHRYLDAFNSKYAAQLLPGHRRAIDAIRRCRTPDAGEVLLACTECDEQMQQPRSCGHRSCPQCQNHETSQWLDRQQAKLLPVEYFMVTFTVPCELRTLFWRHQTTLYNLLFTTVVGTIKDFGLNPKQLDAQMGMTAVLHTHSRRLDYHPHLHVVVPGGGINKTTRQWKKTRGKFLFNQTALAKVFRARLLTAIKAAGLALPGKLPDEWVVDCKHVGKGAAALKYLSRYLYRGVISEHNILANQNGNVTFKYLDSRSGQTRYRTLKGEDFLWLVLQHVLPKGFRRVRDYGFLHGNASQLLALIQLALKVMITNMPTRPRPVFSCPRCRAPLHIKGFLRPAWASG